MPTENEIKVVLDLSRTSELIDELRTSCVSIESINQGYLFGEHDQAARIRLHQVDGEEPYHVFCYKKNVGSRLIEIEQNISERDFSDLWPDATNKLMKIRYLISFVYGPLSDKVSTWEVDVFFTGGSQPYFCMAEHEMPEGQEEPEYYPEVIRKYLKFLVPKNLSSKFSSRLLSNSDYASQLYATL